MKNKRPIPRPKTDDIIDNFVHQGNYISQLEANSQEAITNINTDHNKQKTIKRSLTINKDLDDKLRLEVAKTRKNPSKIIEEALIKYLKD